MAAAETLARVRGACRDLAGAFYRDLSHLGVGGALCQWLSSWRTKSARALYARLGGGVFARGGLGPEPWAGCGWRACCGCNGGEAGAAQPLTGYFRGEDIEAELEASIQLETDSASL